MMPGEGSFEFDQFEVLTVELADDARIPMVVNQREFLAKIDFVHGG